MGEALTLAVSAVLLAGFYAAMAYGLGLIYGVLGIVNVAHGGILMAAAYLAWQLFTRFHVDPYLSIPVALVVFFLVGVAIYRLLVRFLPRGPAGAVQSLLLLFGVWLIIRNLAYLLFTGNDQAIRTRYSTSSITFLGASYSLNRVAVFGISLVALLALHLFLTRTYWGKAIRAVAQNPESCTLVGIDVERVYVLSFGIIVLGGLGSVVGIALGAGVLAFAEVFSIYVVPSYLTSAVGFVLLVVVLVLRPGGLLWVAPLVLPLSEYTHDIVGLTFMFMAAALAWNWLGGYVGQISFGHSAMFGVGGFVAARLALTLDLSFWMAWFVGGLTAGVYALLWGHPTLRLRGPYFAIATIGVGEATRLIATYWAEFTGGSSGLSLPIGQGPTKYSLYWYGLYILAGVVALSYWLRRSRIGLGLIAIKEDVEAAGEVGVNATFYQDLVLFLSGTVLGVCGGLYASYQAFIDPHDMFSFDRSIGFILMAVIGGIGTILGPALGAIVFVMIQEFLLATYPQLYLGLYGLLLFLVILFEPLGIAGLLLRIARRLGYRPAAGVAAGGIASSSSATEGEPGPGGGGVA